MPRLIACDEVRRTDFDGFIAALDDAPFDPRDEDSLAALAPLLKRLANDRRFLADRLIAELESRCAEQGRVNAYGFQVVLLHRTPRYFIRANFWPGRHDSIVRRSGIAPFFYDVPHDHNFSFLTVGYSGPGYWSDYYEYDDRSVAGYPGEKVALRFVERSRLERGKLMLYRARRDVHRQLPADALSVSLNIVPVCERAGWRDQYRFDVEHGTVAGLLNPMPTELLMRLAQRLGGEAGRGLVADVAHRHPSDRIRFGAIAACADETRSPPAALALLRRACDDPSAQVRGLARRRMLLIEGMSASG